MKQQRHSITREEIMDLLQRGKVALGQGDSTSCSRIQVQLVRHIRGLTIPYQIDGPVAEKKYHVERLYMEWVSSPDDREESLTHIVEQLLKWLRNA